MNRYRLPTVLILLFSISVFSEDNISSLNKMGVEAASRGDYEKAVTIFADALKIAPDNQIIIANLSASACKWAIHTYRCNNSEKAMLILRNGLSLLPNDNALRNELTAILVNRGIEFLKRRDFQQARTMADEALQINSNAPEGLCLAGDIAYARHDLTSAQRYWQSALTVSPSNTEIKNRLDRVQKDRTAEQSFSRTTAYHFDIRFDYMALSGGLYDIRSYLMEAYEKVGQLFGRFPEYPITVILYGENEFRLVNNVPEYVAGLYDGKIRIPINFSRYPTTLLKGILFHEYTHAVIHDLSGGSCPLWLNEGIAMMTMHTQSPFSTGVLKQAITSGAVFSLSQLENITAVWRNPHTVQLAYMQSWMMAEYLFHRWSSSSIKQILAGFREGRSFQPVLIKQLNRTPEQFDQEWKTFARSRLALP